MEQTHQNTTMSKIEKMEFRRNLSAVRKTNKRLLSNLKEAITYTGELEIIVRFLLGLLNKYKIHHSKCICAECCRLDGLNKTFKN